MEVSIEIEGATREAAATLFRQTMVNLGGLSPGPTAIATGIRFNNVAAGTYQIGAAPGLPGGYYLASITLGNEDVLGKSVNLRAGTPPVHVSYKPNGGTVSGKVDKGEGNTVVLLPQASLDAFAIDSGRIFTTGPDGGFAIESLAPGSYYAIAVARLEAKELTNRAYLQRLRNNAIRVQVAEGSATSIKLLTLQSQE